MSTKGSLLPHDCGGIDVAVPHLSLEELPAEVKCVMEKVISFCSGLNWFSV